MSVQTIFMILSMCIGTFDLYIKITLVATLLSVSTPMQCCFGFVGAKVYNHYFPQMEDCSVIRSPVFLTLYRGFKVSYHKKYPYMNAFW